MGMNIAGFAIDRNYQDNLDELAEILDLELDEEEVQESIFERASDSFACDNNQCYVYFCPTGTLVMTNTDYASIAYEVKNQKCVSFIVLDSSNAFSLKVTDDRQMIRNHVNLGLGGDGKDVKNEGEKFQMDNDSEIFGAIKYVLGKSFFDIDADEPVLYFENAGYSSHWDDE